MRFINGTQRITLFVVLTLLISACQFVPTTSTVQPVEDSATLAPSKAVNPYLQNRPAVSAAASDHYQQAQAALANQDWAKAELHLQWLTAKAPELSGPYVSLAQLYSRTEQTAKVAPMFKQAIATNSSNLSAYNQYAIFLREQGQFNEAEALYQQALVVWPDYPEGHLNLGILYDLYMGKLALALAHYQQYQNLQPEPDRQVAGWIVDTQRRIKAAGQ
ncbi:tetratricopeptide repeat protein [Oceanicoccus sagamiensis]|uniref:Uncharacterized protein n=1 Tax=Oceanicoccus sagamiensis TaxID=716816 RepID=A0A1X9N4Y0_9GAMM|nr:tetratricopeptide repeat protein [Oceanicoccus sagamiensis]ARN72786.1 hypothetical protein BST96_00860 [Oceanicoccus sagamiensis]